MKELSTKRKKQNWMKNSHEFIKSKQKVRIKRMELKKGCHTCAHSNESAYDYPCSVCGDCYDKWEASWIVKWLNSFDTNSATKCFEAVNLLKQRLEVEE